MREKDTRVEWIVNGERNEDVRHTHTKKKEKKRGKQKEGEDGGKEV